MEIPDCRSNQRVVFELNFEKGAGTLESYRMIKIRSEEIKESE